MSQVFFPQTGEPIDWETAQDAIYTWLHNSTDITVVWANQASPQPDYPFVRIVPLSLVPQGGADENRTDTVSGRPAGQEIDIITAGLRLLTLDCQIAVEARDIQRDPRKEPMMLANKAIAALDRLDIRATLREAGIGVSSRGEAADISEVVEDSILPRVVFEPKFFLASNVVVRTGFIETVRASSPDLGIPEFEIGG